MNDNNFSEHWSQAQFCYFRAEATKNPVIKHLWIQLAQDWIALSDDPGEVADEKEPKNQTHRFEPYLVA